MPKVFCGIDVGTQGARCIIARDDGSVVGKGECPFPEKPASLPKGWSEQDPGSWTGAVTSALSQALSDLNRNPPFADHIAALSVTSTSGTLCVLDAQCRPLVPAIMYNDARSAAAAAEVQEAAEDLTSKLGYRFGSSFALPKVLWLKQERPEVYERAALFISPVDYVIGWLTGNYQRSDQTNMLKFGYDLIEDRWPRFIEEKLGVSRALLAQVQKAGALAGYVPAARADELGLPPHTPVAAGMTDGCAAQIAAGAVSPGQYNTTIGTTMVIKGVSERLLLDPQERIYCHRHPAGWWLPGGASNTGAQCLAVEFGQAETQARSVTALAHSPTRLVAYPLVGKGERFPFMSPEAERFVIGSARDRDELFAAYLEGVACLERLAYETLQELAAEAPDAILSAGGGSRSNAWLQIRADTLNRTVQRPAVAEAAMGAAILAACLAEYGTLTDAARAMVPIEREVHPQREHVAEYGDKYARFVQECVDRGYVSRPWPG